jgi:hypothetical protein
MIGVQLLVLATCLAADEGHVQANPVYRELLQRGVEFPAGAPVRLPGPTITDGMSPAAVREAIEAIPDRRVSVEQLLRRSVVAPVLFRFGEAKPKGRRPAVKTVDVWYVAYGDFELLGDEPFLTTLADEDRQGTEVHTLDAEELSARGITPPAKDDRQQRYVYSSFPLLDQVRLSTTAHHFVTRTDESVLAASKVDRRFTDDEDYPNQWQPMDRRADGTWKLGAPQSYKGAGAYMKVTRLAEPAGALFVELHVVFAEPEGWFGGRNLLRSKLPMVLQSKARDFRRRLAKASAPQ